MYFSYVPSITFSFFNRPLFLNLLFNRFIIIIIIIIISHFGSRPEKQRAASYFSDLIVADIFLVCLAFSLAFDGSEHGSAEII